MAYSKGNSSQVILQLSAGAGVLLAGWSFWKPVHKAPSELHSGAIEGSLERELQNTTGRVWGIADTASPYPPRNAPRPPA